MATFYSDTLKSLEASGNMRKIPDADGKQCIDFSTNDYMGLGTREDLRTEFFSDPHNRTLPMSSSASRLLASAQREHMLLEQLLSQLYGRDTLFFNSGYHANTGIIPALAAGNAAIIADRLSHASIIDGTILSRAQFTRFRHNDYNHLDSLLKRYSGKYDRLIVITESVFSMDGDRSDITRLVELKRRYPEVILYIDEAHAFGVLGQGGLGLVQESPLRDEVDVIVGTFGKAAASAGAFAAVSPVIKSYLVNKARSFIFSTALPPLNSAWTRFIIERMVGMESERQHLQHLSRIMFSFMKPYGATEPSHIMPYIVGDAARAVELSNRLLEHGFKALPIRTPTVPAGTERLRFSLSAAMSEADILGLKKVLEEL